MVIIMIMINCNDDDYFDYLDDKNDDADCWLLTAYSSHADCNIPLQAAIVALPGVLSRYSTSDAFILQMLPKFLAVSYPYISNLILLVISKVRVLTEREKKLSILG